MRDTRVAGTVGKPLGLCIIQTDEFYQLYVAAESRGKGVAAALIADAENRLLENGVNMAWLACAIGNGRAASFYEKSGWQNVGTMTNRLNLSTGPYDLIVWRYEKQLRQS